MIVDGKIGMSRGYETPCFVLSAERLERNLERLNHLEREGGVKILHTLKSFNEATVLPKMAQRLSGMSVSSQQEIAMAKEAGAKDIHLYAPAYREEFLKAYVNKVDTLSFNSLEQWRRFYSLTSNISSGLRINPKLHLPIPDYCNPNVSYSRLGVDGLEFLEAYKQESELFTALEGLHFHALFQSSLEGLVILLEDIEKHYAELLPSLKWLNLGGGHNFTDEEYEVEAFVKLIREFKLRYPSLELYFEPGESVVKGCGEFVTTVLDIVRVGEVNVAILDTSIETHLLDVAIVNQRLKVKGTQSSSTPYFYELAGNSCLQGDRVGEYFFLEELKVGDSVVFEDMMGYSMVKMTEFNGMERAGFYIIE